MSTLEDRKKSNLVKLALIGDSGTGKTGALVSLVQAGFKLRIIDLDEGLDSLVYEIKKVDPSLLKEVQYVSYRDDMKMTPTGPKLKGKPKAFESTLNALEKWPVDGSDPATWGPDYILVLDSLTNEGRAAFQWARAIKPTAQDPRQWYKSAQDLIEDLVANLTSNAFNTNVIVISHVEVTKSDAGIKGYISSIGKALGPKLPRFFNTLIVAETKGFGKNLKRTFKTVPTGLVDAKTPNSDLPGEYPIATAMADIFKALRE